MTAVSGTEGDERAPDAVLRRTVEVGEGGHRASAELITASHDDGTAVALVHAPSGHAPPGLRRALVDAVLDTPEVAVSSRLAATIPLGDTESLFEFVGRCGGVTVHAAGSTALIDVRLDGGRQA